MADIRTYSLVTAAYWGFTLTDGALRMLVLLHFHVLGYSPLQLASLFVLYEIAGIVTNLAGGWLGARYGLKQTLFIGLGVQILALLMLAGLGDHWVLSLSVAYVMVAQGLSGIAKDLTKMSAKSAVKLVAPADDGGSVLYRWVAVLTGSKNALKGLGFFMGSGLLAGVGFAPALLIMAAGLSVVLMASVVLVRGNLGQAKSKPKFRDVFSKVRAINILSGARLFLFASRDAWFVVGLPIFLYEQLEWTFTQVGGFMAAWVIGYGFIQALSPGITKKIGGGHVPEGRMALGLALLLALIPAIMAASFSVTPDLGAMVIAGLIVFGIVFALNSAVHSYLILAYSEADGVALSVGFYYMANAVGRLLGSILSGWSYQLWGLQGCLWVSAILIGLSAFGSAFLPRGPMISADDDGARRGVQK